MKHRQRQPVRGVQTKDDVELARREIDTDASAEAPGVGGGVGRAMFMLVDVGMESKKACQ